jgi:hypothetical protein
MALTGKNNEEKIWNYLKAQGLTDCGVAGLMGNLYAESGLIPTNLQNSYEKKLGYTDAAYTEAVDSGAYSNFVRDSAGYGLAQWTYWSRKQALLDYAKAAGKSVGDLETQLGFLMQELAGSFKAVLNTLKSATTVKAASNAVLLQFERPADQSASVQTKRAGYGQTYYDKYAAEDAEKEETTVATKITTAAQLAERCLDVAQNYKTLYVMGCFGAPMTAANKKRYTQNHTYNKQAARTKMINAVSADTFGFDCVCLIKGLLWGWCGDKTKTYGGASYAVNGVPDIGADTMITKCKDVSTAGWANMEVGEALWVKGHIGIYIGNGLAVECTPSWENKVQVTAVKNIGAKSGYNARTWTKHGKLPYVTYTGATISAPSTGNGGTSKPSTGTTTAADDLKVGDIVEFTGDTHYTNSNAATGVKCKPGKAKVTVIAKGAKHPYHLVKEAGGGSTVYGWVDAADIATGDEEEVYTVVAGDTLWGIAQKKLGSGARWQEISKLNGLTSTNIVVGQKLKIPN